jgi:hypothetical protein
MTHKNTVELGSTKGQIDIVVKNETDILLDVDVKKEVLDNVTVLTFTISKRNPS